MAERWFPKPEVLEKSAGHASFCLESYLGQFRRPDADEESEYRNPSGPKVVPGIYQVRLTVDGKAQNQPLKVIMDPRSPATAEVLAQQLQLGQQIFGETIEARRALAEIGSIQKQLADLQPKLGTTEKAELQSALIGDAIGNREDSQRRESG